MRVSLAILFSVVALIGFGQMLVAPAGTIEVPVSAVVMSVDPAEVNPVTASLLANPTTVSQTADLQPFLPIPPDNAYAGVFNKKPNADNRCNGDACHNPIPSKDLVDSKEKPDRLGIVAGTGRGAVKLIKFAFGCERRQARRASR